MRTQHKCCCCFLKMYLKAFFIPPDNLQYRKIISHEITREWQRAPFTAGPARANQAGWQNVASLTNSVTRGPKTSHTSLLPNRDRPQADLSLSLQWLRDWARIILVSSTRSSLVSAMNSLDCSSRQAIFSQPQPPHRQYGYNNSGLPYRVVVKTLTI